MQTVIGHLNSISPFDSTEGLHLKDTLAWVHSGAQIYRVEKPDKPNKHLVSYSVLVDPRSNKILLADHKNAELWLPCGGHVEPNEDPKDCACREIREELGAEPDLLFDNPLFVTQTMTVGHTAGHLDVSLWFVFQGKCNAEFNFDQKEFHSVHWFSYEEIPFEKSDPNMKRFISKLMQIMA